MRRASSRCKVGASGGCALRVGALRLAVLRRAHRRSSLQSSRAHATAVCASDMFVPAASTRRAATAAGLKGTMPRSAPIAVETSASVGDPRYQRGSVGLLRGSSSDRDTRRGAWFVLGPRRPSLAVTHPPATAPSTCPITTAVLLRLNSLCPAGVVRAGTPPWSRCPLLFSAAPPLSMMPPGSSAPLAGRLASPLTPLPVRGALKWKRVPPTRRLVKLRDVPPAKLSAPMLMECSLALLGKMPPPLWWCPGLLQFKPPRTLLS